MIDVNNVALGTRLRPLSFSVNKGEIVHLLGPNGSGKSTLLELLSGSIDGAGEIKFDNIPLSDIGTGILAKQRAYLSQQQQPIFSIGVYQYLTLSLSAITNVNLLKAEKAVADICDTLEISDKLHRNTSELSGGEWQRVRFASACLQIWPDINAQGKVLLLDEPATGLDIAQQSILYKMLRRIANNGITIIMSNHDINRTLSEADRVLLLRRGELIGEGKPRQIVNVATLESVFGTALRIIEHQGERFILTL